jgi:nucleoside-diphosphate-sugar epimerase
VLTAESWNDTAVALAANQSLPAQMRGFYGLIAMQVGYEKKIWEWVRREKPGYVFNALLLDTAFGLVLDPVEHGGSTAGLVRWLWEGKNVDLHANMAPQWLTDVRDVGKLYLAALTLPGLDGQRIYGFAKRYSWPKVLEIMKELYPQRTGWPELPEAGWDAFEVPADEAEALIKQVGDGKGWISLKDSIRDAAASFLAKGEAGAPTLTAIKPTTEAFQ